jgi:hypothetical protein
VSIDFADDRGAAVQRHVAAQRLHQASVFAGGLPLLLAFVRMDFYFA